MVKGNDKQPNFFIVGAARCGTTTMWQLLQQNPDIYMPEDEFFKEPHYFSEADNPDKSRISWEEYLWIFDKAHNEKRIGEASTGYLPDPTSAPQIYNYNPEAKIIIQLRNPAERAFSLYKWMVQDGYEYSASFEKALELEEKRRHKKIPNFFEPEFYYNYLYFRSGLYAQQVKRYLDRFSSSQVYILRFKHLVSNPQQAVNEVCEFLNVTPHSIQSQTYNPSTYVHSPKLQFLLRKIAKVIFVFRKRILRQRNFTKKGKDFLLELNKSRKKSPPSLDSALKRELLSKYEQDIHKLSALTGKDFTDWLVE